MSGVFRWRLDRHHSDSSCAYRSNLQRTRQPKPPTETRVTLIVERIRAIPRGFVRTYGDLEPSAPRMVGRTLATTRERLPWHRVVRADGSVAKGSRQLALLRKEGVPLIGDRVDLRRARVRAHI